VSVFALAFDVRGAASHRSTWQFTPTATSMGSAALPVMFAFGLLGRRIARTDSTTTSERLQTLVA
jgi:hypothetical protein